MSSGCEDGCKVFDGGEVLHDESIDTQRLNEIIQFGSWLSGHDEKTIIKMHRDWKRFIYEAK